MRGNKAVMNQNLRKGIDMVEKSTSEIKEEKILGEIREGLIGWYPFKKDACFLYVGNDEAVVSFLKEIGSVDVLTTEDMAGILRMKPMSEDRSVFSNDGGMKVLDFAGFQKYDYVISIGTPELFYDAFAVVKFLTDCCNDNGVLLLGLNNRYGVRYFCGDRDPYTDRTFDGITDYQTEYRRSGVTFRGRMYGCGEIKKMLKSAGWECENQHFFAVLPGLEYPAFLYSEGYHPNEAISGRTFGVYHSPDTVFLQEKTLYNGFMDNGLFYQTSNAYLIICSKNSKNIIPEILQVTSSVERGHKNALFTVLTKKNVIKRAAFPEGEIRLKTLHENMQRIKARGISIVEDNIVESSKNGRMMLEMPYIDVPTAVSAFHQLDPLDMDSFYKMLDDFIEVLRKSSDEMKVVPKMLKDTTELLHNLGMDPKKAQRCSRLLEQGPVLENGYLDMKLLNSFYQHDKYIFFDQELDISNLPLSVLVYQAVRDALNAFRGTPDRSAVLRKYGFTNETAELNNAFSECLISSLRCQDRIPEFRRKHMVDLDVQNANLRRSNFSYEEYNERFLNPLSDIYGKKLVLFGAGLYARNFLELYEDSCKVSLIIDNSPNRKKELNGIPIDSADALKDMEPGTFKVIVCIRDCIPVLRQLDHMGIHDAGVFDPAIIASDERQILSNQLEKKSNKEEQSELSVGTSPKKYHVGYIAGVFDLFHVGHVNLLRRAKEQCDYLIVGVVSDEGVRRNKNTRTIIPCEQRMEILKACRYVDMVVKLPLDFADTDTMWKKYHFDVQFSGSDYENEPTWQKKKKFLEDHGAELVFFPYTQSTSTTKIKKELNKLI